MIHHTIKTIFNFESFKLAAYYNINTFNMKSLLRKPGLQKARMNIDEEY